MDDMEQFLINFPDLKHLELIAYASKTIADGYRWEVLIHGLISFKFHFDLKYNSIDKTLCSFRTPFWLEEKHWFVMYDTFHLSSLPGIVSSSVDIPYSEWPLFFTAPDKTLIYNHINEIIVDRRLIHNNDYFTNVKTLVLKTPLDVNILSRVIDLTKIKRLNLSSISYLSSLIPFEHTIPQVDELIIDQIITDDMMKLIRGIGMKQIRKLKIGIRDDDEHCDYIMEELFRLFPYTQSLIFTSDFEFTKMMGHFIDGFPNLSHASFQNFRPFSPKLKIFFRSPYRIFRRSRRILVERFTYRVYMKYRDRDKYTINWWIENQVSRSCTIK
jgi:hypothetical protein